MGWDGFSHENSMLDHTQLPHPHKLVKALSKGSPKIPLPLSQGPCGNPTVPDTGLLTRSLFSVPKGSS